MHLAKKLDIPNVRRSHNFRVLNSPALTYPMIPPAAIVAAYAKLRKSTVMFPRDVTLEKH